VGLAGLDGPALAEAALPARATVRASEGGMIRSEDGAFFLYVPAGALAADTELSVELVPRDRWAPETLASEPVGSVYDVQPDGLTFLSPAYGVQTFAARPAELVAADGSSILAVHRTRTASGVVEAAPSTTVELAGAFGVIGELAHLSSHWATAEGLDGTQVSVRVRATAGMRAVRAPWYVEEVRFQGSDGVALPLATHARSGVVSAGSSNVMPLAGVPLRRGDQEMHDILLAGFGVWAPLDRPFLGARVEGSAGTLPFSLTPTPGWVCESPGDATGRLIVSGAATGAAVHLEFLLEIGSPTCVMREEKPEYLAAVAELGEARVGPEAISVPGTVSRNLAETDGSYGFPIDIPPGATVRVCVSASMPTSILYLPQFSPGFDFVDGAPGCTDITNRDAVNTNTVLLRLDGAGSPNDVTIVTSYP